jgi:hypothetical protein
MYPRVRVTFLPILLSPVRGRIDRRSRTAEAKTIIPHVEAFQKRIYRPGEKTGLKGRLRVMSNT